jgi:hypothetical protein
MYNPARLEKMSEDIDEMMQTLDNIDSEDSEDVFEFTIYGVVVLLHHAQERIDAMVSVYHDLYDPIDEEAT